MLRRWNRGLALVGALAATCVALAQEENGDAGMNGVGLFTGGVTGLVVALLLAPFFLRFLFRLSGFQFLVE